MTDRLYYRDSGLLYFEAEIVAAGPHADKYFTVLDRSAFYPTSGGQLFDTGNINDIEIIDVIEDDNHDVRHISEKPVGKVGDKVKGTVNRERRLKNRQVHTAQHILSQAFVKLFGCDTVSVHLGEAYANIELNTLSLTEEQTAAAEKLANEIIRDNLSVDVIFADDELLKYLPIRKIPEREGVLRVIKIGEFECSACGGTHCHRTSEVGLIKITGFEKVRGRYSVEFLAGVLAVEDYLMRFDVTDRLSKTFTCHVTDLPDKVDKLALENKAFQREVARLQKELLPARAEELAAGAKMMGKVTVCSRIISDLDNNTAGQLASLTADKINGLAIIMTTDRLLLAVSEQSGLHAGELIKKFTARVTLRGGGSQKAAQVGGIAPERFDEYRELIIKLANE
ncbi:MAG: hypothetical protein JXA92_00615 [candidate division Zixibacteria bacterium]|nr:hypothetical protein [candidate division Zixibacteria bacterium]